MKTSKKLIKKAICLFLIAILNINTFGAIVSDNDGSAFITKAEFDALKSSFQAQIDEYNTSIDSKIDGAIAAYLAGIKISTLFEVENLYDEIFSLPLKMTNNGRFAKTSVNTKIGWNFDLYRRNGFRDLPGSSTIVFDDVLGDYLCYKNVALNVLYNKGILTSSEYNTLINNGLNSSSSLYLMSPVVREDLSKITFQWDGRLNWLSGSLDNGEFVVKDSYIDSDLVYNGSGYQWGYGQGFTSRDTVTIGALGYTSNSGALVEDPWDEQYIYVDNENFNFKTSGSGTGYGVYVDEADAFDKYNILNSSFSGKYYSSSTLSISPSTSFWSNDTNASKINEIAYDKQNTFFIGYKRTEGVDKCHFECHFEYDYLDLANTTASILIDKSFITGDAGADYPYATFIDWAKVLFPAWTFANGYKGTDLYGNNNISERGSLSAQYINYDIKVEDSAGIDTYKRYNFSQGFPICQLEEAGDIIMDITFADSSIETYKNIDNQSEVLPNKGILMFTNKTPKFGASEWLSDENLLEVEVNKKDANKINEISFDGKTIQVRIEGLEKGDIIFMNWCALDYNNEYICHGILNSIDGLYLEREV